MNSPKNPNQPKKTGPKPKYKKSTIRTLRFPDDEWEHIPGVKSDFIVQAVREKLNRNKKGPHF
jgi:hypothetical protein